MSAIKPMRVMQVLPALGPGGAERSTLEIAQALIQSGHEAIIVAGPGAWSARATALGATWIELDLSGKSPLQLRHVWRLRQLLLKHRPDIVHTRSRLPSWLCYLARRTIGQHRPHWVSTVHGLHSISRYSAIQHAADRVIAVSDTTKNYVATHYPHADLSRIEVIERGVSGQEFDLTEAELRAGRERFLAEFPKLRGRRMLLLPGRATRLKGHAQAIALLARLRHQQPDLCLVCPGSVDAARSDYLHELKTLAGRLDVADHVVFCASRSDLAVLYRSSVLVLQLSNRAESFGRTVAEALYCGTPVAGVDLGGVGEQLRKHFPQGCLEADKPEEWVPNVLQVMEAKHRIDASRIARLADMQAATLNLYQRVMS